MKNIKNLKQLTQFKSEEEERKFWDTHDSAEYIDWSKAKLMQFPNLKPSTRTVTIRLPEGLLHSLKVLANKKDVPYQSLMKMFLAEKVRDEGTASVK